MSRKQKQLTETPEQLSCYTFGVNHHTEGIALLMNLGSYHLLLDCGVSNIELLLKNQDTPIDFVFCSHAHLDHSRGLLKFHQKFPQIPIYTSEVTAQLLSLNWLDQNPDSIVSFLNVLPWRCPKQIYSQSSLTIKEDLTIELFPAGHLPGAAAILIKYATKSRTYKIFYTGDFCLSNLQLVEGLSLETLRGLAPDILIIEGSYGTARHPHRRQQEKHLMERMITAIDSQQNIILPVPTLGLGQEIIKLLRSHHQFTGKKVDIWVDGNMALACDRYLELIDYFPQNVQNFARHQSLFWDEKILPYLKRITDESQRYQLGDSASIVLTDNLDYIRDYCQNKKRKWLILLSEYSELNDSGKLDSLIAKFDPEKVRLETYLLTEHSDGKNTTQLIHNLRPQHVVFVHGLPAYLADLTSLEELQNRYQLHCPSVNTLVELPIGNKFIQPVVQPKNNYEGELNETGAFITITLPDQINQDSRWQNFADTGLIEARWQGEELVLRGLSQRELLQQNNLSRRQLNKESCSNCIYYQDQHCSNPLSPLYEFKVPSNGYCPVFESSE